MAMRPDKPLQFPVHTLPPEHEEGQRPVVSPQTLAILDGLHIQLGEYFSTYTDIRDNKTSMTAGDMVHEIIIATQALGRELPFIYHTYIPEAGGEGGYEEEKYMLWTGSAEDTHRHPKMFVILEYTVSEQKQYQLMIVDIDTAEVLNRYNFLEGQQVTNEAINDQSERTSLENELHVLEQGSDQHIVSIFLDPDLFGSGGSGEKVRRAA